MNIAIAIILSHQKTTVSKPTQNELSIKAAQVATKVYGQRTNPKPWRQTSDDPLELFDGYNTIFFSKNEPGRLHSLVSGVSLRMKNGPKQGEKFRTQDEWEQHGFRQVAKVWNDIDGYVGEFRKVGEQSFTVQGHKSWDSNSNKVTVIWFTHPIRGLLRQFSCTMDMATGETLNLSCSPYHPAPSKLIAKFDNSPKRKVKIAPPPAGMTVESYRKAKAGAINP